ncbi:MAG: ankyrin repeat protein 17-like, partial [Chthonomonadales bacterium]|nr:ankyrin repeat protein 17-like [Chthonomonadales bacterium]
EQPILLARSAQMAQLLMDHGADIHAGSKMWKHTGENALAFASMRGDKPLISFLLAHGFDVNSGGDGSPIVEAAEYADVETVRLLLQHGAKVGPNSPGEGALWLAIASQNSDSAQLLLKYGAAVNVKGEDTPLAEAANQDDVETARELLERGADVNADKGAALLAACESCDEDLVEMLLEHGANPNVQTSDGSTAIQRVRANEDPPGDADDIVALLKKHGAKR